MSKSGKNRDDLTRIKGIGPAKQKWFQATFDVTTFEGLAALNAKDIEQRLKEDRKIPRPKEIRYWLQEAKRIAEAEGKRAAKQSAADSIDEWSTVASFVVDIEQNQAAQMRTSVQHVETDDNQSWDGVEENRLCRWIGQQVRGEIGELPPSEAELLRTEAASVVESVDESPAVLPKAIEPPDIVVKQVAVEQAGNPLQRLTTIYDGRALTGILQHDSPFAISTHLGFENADERPSRISVQYFIRNRRTGTKWELSESVEIQDGESEEQVVLSQDLKLPQGQYILSGNIRSGGKLLPSPIEIPLLQVI